MSGLFRLNFKDIGKSLLIAALTSICTGLLALLQSSPPTIPSFEQIGTLLSIGAAAGISYLVKNVFTNSDNKLLTPETPADG